MKNARYIFFTLSFATVFLMLAGCDSSTTKTSNSTLQIMGLNEGAVIEGDSSSRTLYFTYNFGNNGVLNIHQLSEDDYKKNDANSPIEENVGQFGLFALAHAQSSEDPIVYGDIKFNTVATCGNNPINLPNYGNASTFTDENGKKSIDLSRNLQLPEFVNNMHNQLNIASSECFSLEEMEANPQLAISRSITLRMNIEFNYKTKSGVASKKEYTLIFKPSLPLAIALQEEN